MSSVVVHYGELALKGRNRPWFIKTLVRAIQAALAGLSVVSVVSVGALVGRIVEETARVIDAEIKRLIDEAETTARHILTEQRQPLDALTELLLEREVIEGEQLRELLIGAPPLPAGAFAGAGEAAGAAPPGAG
jgi:hypothetical protein